MKATSAAKELVSKLWATPGERVERARQALQEAEARAPDLQRAYEETEARLREAMATAATGGPDLVAQSRVACDRAKAVLEDQHRLIEGLRTKLAAVEAEERDAILRDRAKQREAIVADLLATATRLDAELVAAGATYKALYDLRVRLFELSDAPDKGSYGPAPKTGVAGTLADLLLWKGSGGRLGRRLMMQGQDESLAHPAFTGLAQEAVYQLAGTETPKEAA